jgi:hypothetical protein
LPPATIIFFDDNGQQFLSINDIYISRQHANGHPLISPANYNMGDLLFSQLQHFTTATPFIITTALCRQIRGQIKADQVYSFPHPPQVMQMLHFQGTLPGTAIYATRYAPKPVDEPEANSCHINGYFGFCNYYF